MGRYAAMLGGEAEGDRDVELGERLHLPVEPVERVRAKAVRPGKSGSEMAHAKTPHPFHRCIEPVILEVKPLAQSQCVRRFRKYVEPELRRAVFTEQAHVE